ncbi:PEGA domain-containing protein, partial [bacterium]
MRRKSWRKEQKYQRKMTMNIWDRPFIRVLSAILVGLHVLGPASPLRAADGVATFAIIGPPSPLTPEQKALWAEAVEPVKSDPLLLMKDREAVKGILDAWVEETARTRETLNASSLAMRGKIQALLQSAWDSYYGFDFNGSLSDLQIIDTSLDALADLSLQADIFFETLVLKGMNSRALGRKDYMIRFQEAAGIKPDARLPSEVFSPEIIEVFEKTRKRLQSGPRSTLTVSGHPAGSTVFIDGRETGKSPVTLDDIPAGPHFIGIEHEGYESFRKKAGLEDWKVSTINFDLAPSGPSGAPESFFVDRVVKGDERSLMELSRRLEVDYLVVGSVGKDGLVVWLINEDGNLVSQAVLHSEDEGSEISHGRLYAMLIPLKAGRSDVVPTARTELNIPEVSTGDVDSGEEIKSKNNTKW